MGVGALLTTGAVCIVLGILTSHNEFLITIGLIIVTFVMVERTD